MREKEAEVCERIDAALERIKSKVCLMGMAGRWHIGTASDVLKNPGSFRQYIDVFGEQDEAKYLSELPRLIAETSAQDQRCGEFWNDAFGQGGECEYLLERSKLLTLLNRFHLHLKRYERVSRQPEKPLLRNAWRLLQAGHEDTPEAASIERILRMRLRDFILLEEGLMNDFQDLDDARDAICELYKDLATTMASIQPNSDHSTLASALVGLRRAAGSYDRKRAIKQGFGFEAYAPHWIQEAIDKRRR